MARPLRGGVDRRRESPMELAGLRGTELLVESRGDERVLEAQEGAGRDEHARGDGPVDAARRSARPAQHRETRSRAR